MEHLRLIGDTLDNLELPEGDYLKMMDALKKLHEVLPRHVEPEEAEDTPRNRNEDYHSTHLRMNGFARILYDFEFFDTYRWAHETTEELYNIYTRMSNNVESGNTLGAVELYHIYSSFKYFKDEVKELFLKSKAIRKSMVERGTIWKVRLLNAEKLTVIDPKNIKNKNKKSHILEVKINFPHTTAKIFTETYKIRLGGNHTIIRSILEYYLQKLVEDNSLNFTKFIMLYEKCNKDSEMYKPTLHTSGLTNKTKDKNRCYKWNRDTFDISLKYLSKYKL